MRIQTLNTALKSALPCPARNLYDLQVSGYRDGLVSVSFEIPEPMIHAFTALLDSLTESFRFLQFKAKSVKAAAKVHDPVAIEHRKKQFSAFEKTVLDRYDKFVAAGFDPREAIRQTKSFFMAKDQYITCFGIELIIRPYGRLSKKKKKGIA